MHVYVHMHTHNLCYWKRMSKLGNCKWSGIGKSFVGLVRSTWRLCYKGLWRRGAVGGQERAPPLTFPPGILAPTLTFQASSLKALFRI